MTLDDPYVEKCPGTGAQPTTPSMCPVCGFESRDLRFWRITPYHRRMPATADEVAA